MGCGATKPKKILHNQPITQKNPNHKDKPNQENLNTDNTNIINKPNSISQKSKQVTQKTKTNNHQQPSVSNKNQHIDPKNSTLNQNQNQNLDLDHQSVNQKSQRSVKNQESQNGSIFKNLRLDDDNGSCNSIIKERLDSLSDLYENIMVDDDQIDLEQIIKEVDNKYSANEIQNIRKDKLDDLKLIEPRFIDLQDSQSIYKFCKGEFLQVLLQNKFMTINFIVYSWQTDPYHLYEAGLELYQDMKTDGFVYKDYNNKEMVQMIQEQMHKYLEISINEFKEMGLRSFKYDCFAQKFIETMAESYQLIFQQYKKTKSRSLQMVNDQYREFIERNIKIYEVNRIFDDFYKEMLKNQKQLELHRKNNVQVDWWTSDWKKTNLYIHLKKRYFDLQGKINYEMYMGKEKDEQLNGDYIGGFRSRGLKQYYSSGFKKMLQGVQSKGDDVSIGNASHNDDQQVLHQNDVLVQLDQDQQQDQDHNASQHNSQIKTQAKSQIDNKANTQAKSQTNIQIDNQAKSQAKSQTKSQTKSQNKSQTKSNGQSK